MTFSIIGIDRDKEQIGSAVASKWTGVGGCVIFFRPGVGFVNIQNHSYAQIAYRILDNMEQGLSLDCSLEQALQIDTASKKRQCILASLKDLSFYAYSGPECSQNYSHKVGENFAAAGNTLSNLDVIEAMAEAFESNQGKTLTERLLLSLEAGQAQGGDSRGQEAAAIKVFEFSYPIQRFYPIDLRVDSDDQPIIQLRYLSEVFGEKDRRVVL